MDSQKTKVSEIRLKLRRLKGSDDGTPVLPGIVELGHGAATLLPELVKAIERGASFAAFLLRDIITQHKHTVLLNAATRQYGPAYFSLTDKCYLFQAGFVQFQADLLSSLRELFDRDDPLKFGIVAALAEAGTVSLVKDLEDIEVWTSQRVSDDQVALDSPDPESLVPDQALKQIDARLRRDFLNNLRQAINRVRARPDIAQCNVDLNVEKKATAKQSAVEVLLGSGAPERDAGSAGRKLHPVVRRHSQPLLAQGNYFHAVSEAVKAYVKEVRTLSQSSKDGADLMFEAFGPKGALKVAPGQNETDENVQAGTMFLSVGLIRAVRNALAHEPAMDWPMTREDALDVLSLVSFLFRQLDKATGIRRGSSPAEN